MSTMIKPTVGRKVWFRPNGCTSLQLPNVPTVTYGIPLAVNDQPFDATVVYVWGDRMVNLLVLDHYGHNFTATSVPLLQPGDPVPTSGFYAEWVPYQQGQAKKESA